MTRNVTCLVLLICLGCPVFAQNVQDAKDEQIKKLDAEIKKLRAAADKGVPVPVKNLLVNDNVRVQAVLIPQKDARRIFSKELADNYAIIQLIVGNKSDDASLIIHGIFIDYSRWTLSGSDPSDTSDGAIQPRDKPFQAATNPHHVASEEYRIVRGQLLNAQNWTWRNLTYRALTFLGSLAGAGTFAFNATETKLISALNGNLPSGFATLFPDDTIEQLKRVDDFGYHTPKLVAQHDSEVIICFFPIDRFLTPGFRKLYLKSPALFFAPGLMLVDTKIQTDVEDVLGHDLGIKIPIADLREKLPYYLKIGEQRIKRLTPGESSKIAMDLKEFELDKSLFEFGVKRDNNKFNVFNEGEFKKFLALDYIFGASLNAVTVVVDGVMTLDTTGIAAKIDGIEFDRLDKCGDEHSPCFWTDLTLNDGTRTGRIRGSYLTGGEVKIQEAKELGITEIKTITGGSSDQVMHFSFKLTKAIDTQTKPHFVISKPAKSGDEESKTTDSSPREYVIDYGPALHGPTITTVEPDKNENSLTITGTEFIDAPPNNALVVTLHTPGNEDVEVKPKTPFTGTKLVVDIPNDNKVAGCWSVMIKVGEKSAPNHNNTFVITPTPKLTKVALDKNDDTVTIEGTDLIDARECGGRKLSFHFTKDKSTMVRDLTIADSSSHSATKWTLNKPTKIAKGKWHVNAQLDGKDVTGSAPVDLQVP